MIERTTPNLPANGFEKDPAAIEHTTLYLFANSSEKDLTMIEHATLSIPYYVEYDGYFCHETHAACSIP